MTFAYKSDQRQPFRFDLPVWRVSDMVASNALLATAGKLRFAAGPVDEIELDLGDPNSEPFAIAEAIWVRLGGQRLRIHLEQPLLAPLLSKAGFGAELGTVAGDPGLAAIVLEHLLSPALNQLEQAQVGPVELADVSAGFEETRPVLGIDFCLRSELWAHDCRGELIAPTEAAAEILRGVIAPYLAPPGEGAMDIAQPCRLQSRPFVVTQGDLWALVPGDGLLLPPGFDLGGDLTAAFSPCHLARVAWRADQLVVTGLTNTESMAKEQRAMPSFEDDTLTIEDLTVTLSLELDRAEVSFAALRDLRVGSVLPFQTGRPEKVRVLANGRPFATADLILVEDRLAVRVTSLLSRTE